MSKKVTEEDVKYIASLSRIHLRKEEIASLSKNLEDILGYVEKLGELNIKDIEPTSHVMALKNVFRKDMIKPSLDQSDALKLSVEKHLGSFKVPKVIE